VTRLLTNRKETSTSAGQPVASRIGTRFHVPPQALAAANSQEVLMSTITHPPKHVVREYLERRARDSKPPPTPEEIRRQLGWGMLLSDFKVAPSRN
jgi:hypothetical protein